MHSNSGSKQNALLPRATYFFKLNSVTIKDDNHVQRFLLQAKSTLLHSDWSVRLGMLDSPINIAK